MQGVARWEKPDGRSDWIKIGTPLGISKLRGDQDGVQNLRTPEDFFAFRAVDELREVKQPRE